MHKTIVVKVTGEDYQIDRLTAGLAERPVADIEIVGGHGRNREYFLGLYLETEKIPTCTAWGCSATEGLKACGPIGERCPEHFVEPH